VSEQYVIRDKNGDLLYSLFTGKPMMLSKSLAEETRGDLDFEHRDKAPHSVCPSTDINGSKDHE